MTAASIAQLIAAGDMPSIPPWHVAALEARADFVEAVSEARAVRGPA